MAAENGTVMDVCAEWRDCIESADPSVWNNERIAGLVETTKAHQLAYLARIEAAWRRERSEIEANALVVGGIVEAARQNPVGNAAAIYAALVKIHDLTNALDEKCGVDPVEIRDIARAALSAPERNCDMYATYAEAAEAHKEYATAYIMRASNKFDFPMEFDEWLLAPAEEKGVTA